MYYQTIIRSSGGIGSAREDFIGFKTYDEAFDFCENEHWQWMDENGFFWGIEIEERDGELEYISDLFDEYDEEPEEEVEYITTYAPDTDMTFILKEVSFVLPNGDERYPKSTEVVGFYYGQPDEKLTKEYTNSRKAEYDF